MVETTKEFRARQEQSLAKSRAKAQKLEAFMLSDPAFPLIVANLRQMADECRSIFESRGGEST